MYLDGYLGCYYYLNQTLYFQENIFYFTKKKIDIKY